MRLVAMLSIFLAGVLPCLAFDLATQPFHLANPTVDIQSYDLHMVVPDLLAEDLLDRDLDLGLVRVRVHHERVDVVLDQPVGLLRDHRRQDDVTRVCVRSHA